MDNTAGFGIVQSLIPYTEESSYGRAFLVGLINTLMVAGIGIVLATILGFFVGVARLSTNWLVSKIAWAYVEVMRNIPLLLQLFFWYFTVLRPLPAPVDSLSPDGSWQHAIVGERDLGRRPGLRSPRSLRHGLEIKDRTTKSSASTNGDWRTTRPPVAALPPTGETDRRPSIHRLARSRMFCRRSRGRGRRGITGERAPGRCMGRSSMARRVHKDLVCFPARQPRQPTIADEGGLACRQRVRATLPDRSLGGPGPVTAAPSDVRILDHE